MISFVIIVCLTIAYKFKKPLALLIASILTTFRMSIRLWDFENTKSVFTGVEWSNLVILQSSSIWICMFNLIFCYSTKLSIFFFSQLFFLNYFLVFHYNDGNINVLQDVIEMFKQTWFIVPVIFANLLMTNIMNQAMQTFYQK